MTKLEWPWTDRQTGGQAENNRALPTFVGGALTNMDKIRINCHIQLYEGEEGGHTLDRVGTSIVLPVNSSGKCRHVHKVTSIALGNRIYLL